MICDDCLREYNYCYRVPDHVWEQIAPIPETLHMDLGGLLCIDCANRRARELGIELRFHGTDGWWFDE